MTLLRPCPRCTQPVPVSAAFCRRCGLGVAAPTAAAGPPPAGAGRQSGRGRGVLVGLAVAGAIGGIVAGRHARHWTVVRPRSWSSPGVGTGQPAGDPGELPQTSTGAPRVYPLPGRVVYPPSAERPPGYGDGDRARDRRRR